uniref:Uncharacterized protein n=1 Tax=Anguilla anguilla TaxID=7936 RepID=A0A0E9UN14_ANGAN
MCTLSTFELFDYKSKIVQYRAKSRENVFVPNIMELTAFPHLQYIANIL